MIFEAQGKRYRISFKHHVVEGPPPVVETVSGPRAIRAETQCFIVQLTPTDSTVIGQGRARCSALDQYKKEEGRQLALRRACESAWPAREDHPLWGKAFETYSKRRQPPAKTQALAEIRGLLLSRR